MSGEKRIVILRDSATRRRAHEAIDAAPDGYAMRLTPPTRSLEQSAKFHAICGDLAKQLPYAGKRRTLDEWKFLLISGHSVATKEGTEIVPGLEGEFLNLRESSASMTVARMGSLIEYATAYAVSAGVRLSG
jgi:hypothetical protein